MTKNTKLANIKEQLQKIAIDIETPDETAAPEASPEAVMELVDDAIQILEVAEEAIPAETPGEETVPNPEKPIIGAKARKAQEEDEEEDKKEKEAKVKEAQLQLKKAQDELDKDDDDDDDEKKELEARLKTLEAELNTTKVASLAEQWIELYPESQRQAKYDEITESKESIDVLTAKYETAKEVFDANKNPNQYKPAKNESGFLFKKAKLAQVELPPWKV